MITDSDSLLKELNRTQEELEEVYYKMKNQRKIYRDTIDEKNRKLKTLGQRCKVLRAENEALQSSRPNSTRPAFLKSLKQLVR